MMLLKRKTILIPLIFLSVTVFSLAFLAKSTLAATCAPNECEDQGKYDCQSNTMCCTGTGCPSWGCVSAGFTYWGQRSLGDEGYCTKPSYDYLCWERFIVGWCGYFDAEIAIAVGGTCAYCGGVSGPCSECTAEQNCSNANTGDICGQLQSGGDKVWCKNYGSCNNDNDNDNGSCTIDTIGTTLGSSNVDHYKVPYNYGEDITFKWSVPRNSAGEIDWGKCCNRCTSNYKLIVDGVVVGTYEKGTKTATFTSPGNKFGVGEHKWKVRVRTGDAGSVTSGTKSFTVNPRKVNVTGLTWDATGTTCNVSLATKKGKEITNDVFPSGNDGVTPTANNSYGGVTGNWNPNGLGDPSYIIRDVYQENDTRICIDFTESPISPPNSRYLLKCRNNGTTGVYSGACLVVNVNDRPEIVNLGYQLVGYPWFQSINGDVFGGCLDENCTNSVSVSVPAAGTLKGGFVRRLIAGVGTLFGHSGLSVSDNRYSQDQNRRLENTKDIGDSDPDSWWPDSFTFVPPSSAEKFSGGDCDLMFEGGNLKAGEIYKATGGCVNRGLEGTSGAYNVSGDGVAVVYVTGGDDVTFGGTSGLGKNFRSNKENTRVLFISQVPVRYKKEIGMVDPTPTTSPHIQAGVITERFINFGATGNADDTTIIIEGPLVTKNGPINFRRDRSIDNGYPAEVIVYNPIYLTSFVGGVSAVDITWILEN